MSSWMSLCLRKHPHSKQCNTSHSRCIQPLHQFSTGQRHKSQKLLYSRRCVTLTQVVLKSSLFTQMYKGYGNGDEDGSFTCKPVHNQIWKNFPCPGTYGSTTQTTFVPYLFTVVIKLWVLTREWIEHREVVTCRPVSLIYNTLGCDIRVLYLTSHVYTMGDPHLIHVLKHNIQIL